MARWNDGDDVVLQVAGKYSLLGKTVGQQKEDGRVLVLWEDRTTTELRGDLLVTPGEAAAEPTWAEVNVGELLAELAGLREAVNGADNFAAKYWRQRAVAITERDRARALAARLEAQLAQVQRAVDPMIWATSNARCEAVRTILEARS